MPRRLRSDRQSEEGAFLHLPGRPITLQCECRLLGGLRSNSDHADSLLGLSQCGKEQIDCSAAPGVLTSLCVDSVCEIRASNTSDLQLSD